MDERGESKLKVIYLHIHPVYLFFPPCQWLGSLGQSIHFPTNILVTESTGIPSYLLTVITHPINPYRPACYMQGIT